MDLNRFIAVAKLTEEDLYDAIFDFLLTIYPKVIKGQDRTYMFAKGQSSVCLVAHLDTVFRLPPTRFYHAKFDKNVILSPQGLGADDRAGVYAILTLILQGLRPSVIFTTGEEMGGIGAWKLAEDYHNCPTESSCLIELDRRGKHDSVYYDCGNRDFENFINSFGFKSKFGVFSDISILAPSWDIAAVNLSVGFKNEHSYQEKLNTKYLDLTIKKVNDIILSEPKFYDYQESEEINFWNGCFTCISGDCENCQRLKDYSIRGGFKHGSQRQYR